jgi:hypothetical protein
MKWLQKINHRETSVTMFLLAMLLISSMTLREYAHFIDHARHFHGQPGTSQPNFDHEAKFHFVTQAMMAFEPPCWHQKVVAIISPLCEKNLLAQPHLLPETRAPPASV